MNFIGLKIQDTEGNIFVITEITVDRETGYPNGVILKGEAGEKEVSSFDLLFYTVKENAKARRDRKNKRLLSKLVTYNDMIMTKKQFLESLYKKGCTLSSGRSAGRRYYQARLVDDYRKYYLHKIEYEYMKSLFPVSTTFIED